MLEGWLKRIDEAIKADGRKPRTISKAAGFGPNYVGEMFTKGKVPGIDRLLALCAELNVSATYVLTGSDVSPESEEVLSILASLPADQQKTFLQLARQLREAGQR